MQVTIEIKDDNIESLIISALEGGSNYWYTDVKNVSGDWSSTEYASQVTKGKGLRIRGEDHEGDGTQLRWYTLDKASAAKSLSILSEKYPWHFADIVKEDADATTGDVFLQCALFGDIVYG